MKISNEDAKGDKWMLLLDKLQDFDLELAPVGLYGIRDSGNPAVPHPLLKLEWERLLKPLMHSLGCNPTKHWLADKRGDFRFQDGGPIELLRVVRLSKIKVRKYGNAYRVDPHNEFEHRWKEAAIGATLDHLWKWRTRTASLVLLIGFAKERNPFSKELSQLQDTSTFKKRFQSALVKTWDDPYKRGFKLITVLWHIPREKK